MMRVLGVEELHGEELQMSFMFLLFHISCITITIVLRIRMLEWLFITNNPEFIHMIRFTSHSSQEHEDGEIVSSLDQPFRDCHSSQSQMQNEDCQQSCENLPASHNYHSNCQLPMQIDIASESNSSQHHKYHNNGQQEEGPAEHHVLMREVKQQITTPSSDEKTERRQSSEDGGKSVVENQSRAQLEREIEGFRNKFRNNEWNVLLNILDGTIRKKQSSRRIITFLERNSGRKKIQISLKVFQILFALKLPHIIDEIIDFERSKAANKDKLKAHLILMTKPMGL